MQMNAPNEHIRKRLDGRPTCMLTLMRGRETAEINGIVVNFYLGSDNRVYEQKIRPGQPDEWTRVSQPISG
jgi:hypothetical protein